MSRMSLELCRDCLPPSGVCRFILKTLRLIMLFCLDGNWTSAVVCVSSGGKMPSAIPCRLLTLCVLISLCWILCSHCVTTGDLQEADISASPVFKRVAGGIDVGPTEFPWQVRLRSFGQVIYSGALIADNWVVTAASCFDGNYSPSQWNAKLGGVYTSWREGTRRAVFVDSILLHGGYSRPDDNSTLNDRPLPHDLALVKLNLSHIAGLGVKFPHLRMAQSEMGLNDSTCYVIGWGSLGPDQGSASRLQKVRTKLLDHRSCGEATGHPVDPQFLCGRAFSTGGGPCKGDRGSPVVCEMGQGWALVGVVGQEFACAGSSSSVVGRILSIPHHFPWINKTIHIF
ncbi:kallikrein 1-related peptidase b27 [Aplysia californica]|uniref:Kallikrein 1-related peptidase b27 n=1 Tax=Aplysia californica TaxID=6500 RepID=A0ABM0K341_APLCA|nr:kallikrein 1-related peptidase b27 [Aplysia californica]